MQRQRLDIDIAKDSGLFENLVADQRPPRYPDYRELMLNAIVPLQSFNLF